MPELLKEDEMILMKNNRGGVWAPWSFAGIEMGLLTQVEWGPVLKEIRSRPTQWSNTLMRLLQVLTLRTSDRDWLDFRDIVNKAFDDLSSRRQNGLPQ